MQSEAWRHLSGSAVKVLLALAALEKGDNNGEFFLSARKGAAITGLGKNAVNRALHELQDKGFIYCAVRGAFSRKTPHAACWGLTWQAGPKGSDHRAPSHSYEKWRPAQKRGPRTRDAAVPETATTGPNGASDCAHYRDSETAKTAERRQTLPVSKTGTHNSYQPLDFVQPVKRLPNPAGIGWWQPDLARPLSRLAQAAILSHAIRQAIDEGRLAA
jgi:hypothetical protein